MLPHTRHQCNMWFQAVDRRPASVTCKACHKNYQSAGGAALHRERLQPALFFKGWKIQSQLSGRFEGATKWWLLQVFIAVMLQRRTIVNRFIFGQCFALFSKLFTSDYICDYCCLWGSCCCCHPHSRASLCMFHGIGLPEASIA